MKIKQIMAKTVIFFSLTSICSTGLGISSEDWVQRAQDFKDICEGIVWLALFSQEEERQKEDKDKKGKGD